MAVLALCCCEAFSLVVMSRGFSLVALCGLLIALASLPGCSAGEPPATRDPTPAAFFSLPRGPTFTLGRNEMFFHI